MSSFPFCLSVTGCRLGRSLKIMYIFYIHIASALCIEQSISFSSYGPGYIDATSDIKVYRCVLSVYQTNIDNVSLYIYIICLFIC